MMNTPRQRRQLPQVALVTAANRGIGLAIAQGLAERGLRVLLTARDPAHAAAAATALQAHGLDVVPHQLDVTDQESISRLAVCLGCPRSPLPVKILLLVDL